MDMSVPLGIGFTSGRHWGENDLTQEQICDIVSQLNDFGFDQAESDDGEIKIVSYEEN